ERITRNNNAPAPIVTSAGALVDGLKVMRAKKIVVLTPYIKPLTKLIVDYIANEGYQVLDYVALEISHNLDVARHDQNELPGIMQGMKIANADVLASLPACSRHWPLFQRLKHLRASPWSLPRSQRHMLCCVYLISNQSSLVLAPCCLAPIEAPSDRDSGPAFRHPHRAHRMDRRRSGLADIPLA